MCLLLSWDETWEDKDKGGSGFFLRDLKSGLESRLQMIIKVVPGALEPERQLSRWHTAHPTTHLHV